ncbi:hypothetical protein GGQ99_001978, partial [Aminobacter niigataensis]|nr:hypothetical protein [Aminobacter niigataensis]
FKLSTTFFQLLRIFCDKLPNTNKTLRNLTKNSVPTPCRPSRRRTKPSIQARKAQSNQLARRETPPNHLESNTEKYLADADFSATGRFSGDSQRAKASQPSRRSCSFGIPISVCRYMYKVCGQIGGVSHPALYREVGTNSPPRPEPYSRPNAGRCLDAALARTSLCAPLTYREGKFDGTARAASLTWSAMTGKCLGN